MKKLIPFFIFVVICSNPLKSQQWVEEFLSPNPNYFSIQNKFYEYMKDKDTTQKGLGWKQFKRWEYFWKNRIYEDGSFPSQRIYFDEIKNARINKLTGDRIQGNPWVPLGPNQSGGGYAGLGRLNMVKVHPLDSNKIFVASGSGGLWFTIDGGKNWNTVTDFLPTLGVADIAFDTQNPDIIYMATGDADQNIAFSIGILKSTDGGFTWNETGLKFKISEQVVLNKIKINPENNAVIIASGSSGIFRTNDFGVTWTKVQSGNFKDLEFKPSDPSVLYASGNNIYRSLDSGLTWKKLQDSLPSSGINRIALAVTPANSELLYALCSKSNNSSFGGLYRSTNSGDSWVAMSVMPNILGYSPEGKDNRGQGWYDLCLAASPYDENVIFAGGINLWKSTDAGVTWNISSMWYKSGEIPEVHADQHDLNYDAVHNALYAGNDGGVYKSNDDGATWTWLGSGLVITQFYKFANSQIDPSVIIAGSQDNGTKFSKNGVWQDAIGGDGMDCVIDYTDPDIMYGSLYYGVISKTTDGGLSWDRINDSDRNGKYDDIDETGAWVTPFVQDPKNHNIIYIGMANIWKTTDGGISFTKLSNFGTAKINNLKVAPSNPKYIYASLGASFKKTSDGGLTWSDIKTPYSYTVKDIEIHPTNPQKIWIVYSNFNPTNKVYYSTDAGSTWSNISSGLPAIPVNCIIYQKFSANRLYVGTDIGVYYREGNMSKWEYFSDGLPSVIVNDLDIIYSDNSLRVCTYGRGIWEKSLNPPLDPPLLVSPPDNHVVIIDSLEFRWKEVAGADSYTFQLSLDSVFSSFIENKTGIKTTFYRISALSSGLNYYWRVIAQKGSNTSDFSESRKFAVSLESAAPNTAVNAHFKAFIAPHPVSGNAKLNLSVDIPGQYVINLYNSLGEEILLLANNYFESKDYEFSFSSDDLPSGSYFLRIQCKNSSSIIKFIISK